MESNIAWGDYLYDSFEIMLFALRGNLKSFFTMGIPDEVRVYGGFHASFSCSSSRSPV